MKTYSADNNDRDFDGNVDREKGVGAIEESELISSKTGKHTRKRSFKGAFKIEELSNTILFIAVFIGIWQIAYLSGIWPKVSLPSPIMVVEAFYDLILDNTLLVSIGITLYRLLIGFAVSIVIGIGVGLAMVKFTGFGKTMSSFAIGLQSFPSVAWVPFAILLIGLNDIGILFVVIMSSVFSVMISAYSGIRNIPPIYLKAARNMGAKGFALFRHLMIPAATPALIVGIKQAWSFAWHALVGAEILMAASIGIGHILLVGREFQLMDQIIASMITIFALGMIFDKVIFAKLDDKVREKWGLRHEQDIETK
ncbi:ABC transporter permease [Candidatus Nitrosocosmicus franklandus]|uniref:Putative aliphatic sulfonates transport permease protein SsuC n=1 Tax=Candidatus Nitrosocosmicus franklandianus TaxID=1798806 RepID=A0A484IEY4_9ARCH|nr:ABC transporter permease [Candidatus Nitrosocosmicus franklandus]VFJ15387.1 putative aliphatic sulfonates transport permease protein SsuC [Candidatus Nitrosocosmicus franklandus]